MPQFHPHYTLDFWGSLAKAVEVGNGVAHSRTSAENVALHSGPSWAGKIAWMVTGFSIALGTATWVADSNPGFLGSSALNDSPMATFEARFLQASVASPNLAALSLLVPVASELELKLESAKGLLAGKLRSLNLQMAPASEPVPSIVAAVPLPRVRPAGANLAMISGPTHEPDNRSLVQKLSNLLAPRLTLASLTPGDGLSHSGRDLASLRYDNLSAVYDISAHTVYMPDGSELEAHSGFGRLMDDPEHVSERNVGATPPNVYDLKLRGRLFHGVQALRMIPVGDRGTLGRTGLLAHSYMLGPNGDSNGCVSIKKYETFLAAFTKGAIKRLVVVPSLAEEVAALRRST